MSTIQNIKEYNRIINELTIIATNSDTENYHDPVLLVGKTYYNFMVLFNKHNQEYDTRPIKKYFVSGLEVILDENLSVGTVKVVERKHVEILKCLGHDIK